MSFQDLGKYMCRLFHLEESTALRIRYRREETCFSLSNREVLSVDIKKKLPVVPDTKNAQWQQITIAKNPYKRIAQNVNNFNNMHLSL
jgi:hypothetical protein